MNRRSFAGWVVGSLCGLFPKKWMKQPTNGIENEIGQISATPENLRSLAEAIEQGKAIPARIKVVQAPSLDDLRTTEPFKLGEQEGVSLWSSDLCTSGPDIMLHAHVDLLRVREAAIIAGEDPDKTRLEVVFFAKGFLEPSSK